MKTTSRFALAAAAGLFVGALAISPAQAADLGGDCCADLEERVAELEATTVRKGNRVVSVQIYGQVHRGLLIWDDGIDSDAYVVDNVTSSTRWGITGSATMKPGWSAGYKIEIQHIDAASTSVDQTDSDAGSAFSLRRAEMYIQSDQLGRVTWGQTSPATDDLTLINLGGANSDPELYYNPSFFVRFKGSQASSTSDLDYIVAKKITKSDDFFQTSVVSEVFDSKDNVTDTVSTETGEFVTDVQSTKDSALTSVEVKVTKGEFVDDITWTDKNVVDAVNTAVKSVITDVDVDTVTILDIETTETHTVVKGVTASGEEFVKDIAFNDNPDTDDANQGEHYVCDDPADGAGDGGRCQDWDEIAITKDTAVTGVATDEGDVTTIGDTEERVVVDDVDTTSEDVTEVASVDETGVSKIDDVSKSEAVTDVEVETEDKDFVDNVTQTKDDAVTDVNTTERLVVVDVSTAKKSVTDIDKADIITDVSALAWGDLAKGLDSSRGDFIRYDSPSIYGFIVSAAWGEDDIWDVALRFSKEWNSIRFAGGIGYYVDEQSESDSRSELKGSASIMHVPSGIYFTGAAGQVDYDDKGKDEATFYYGQLGITKNWTGYGATSIAVEYGRYDDYYSGGSRTLFASVAPVKDDVYADQSSYYDRGIATGSEVDRYGLILEQAFDSAALEVYANFQYFEGEVDADFRDYGKTTIELEEWSSAWLGARIKF